MSNMANFLAYNLRTLYTVHAHIVRILEKINSAITSSVKKKHAITKLP